MTEPLSKTFDTNSDGYVTRDEFYGTFKAMLPAGQQDQFEKNMQPTAEMYQAAADFINQYPSLVCAVEDKMVDRDERNIPDGVVSADDIKNLFVARGLNQPMVDDFFILDDKIYGLIRKGNDTGKIDEGNIAKINDAGFDQLCMERFGVHTDVVVAARMDNASHTINIGGKTYSEGYYNKFVADADVAWIPENAILATRYDDLPTRAPKSSNGKH